MEVKRQHITSYLLLIVIQLPTVFSHDDDDRTLVSPLFYARPGIYDKKYGYFGEEERKHMLSVAKDMFTFGYDNYMKYAFPADELNPIHCTGRGPDLDDPYVHLTQSQHITSQIL